MAEFVVAVLFVAGYASVGAAVAGLYDAIYKSDWGPLVAMVWPVYVAYLPLKIIYIVVKDNVIACMSIDSGRELPNGRNAKCRAECYLPGDPIRDWSDRQVKAIDERYSKLMEYLQMYK